MRKRQFIAAVSVTVLTLGGFAVASDSPHRKHRFETRLQGFQENPSNSTTGRGQAEIVINDEDQTITFELTYDRLEGVGTTPFVTNGVVTQAHIHVSARHVNGGVAVFFCGGGGKPDARRRPAPSRASSCPPTSSARRPRGSTRASQRRSRNWSRPFAPALRTRTCTRLVGLAGKFAGS